MPSPKDNRCHSPGCFRLLREDGTCPNQCEKFAKPKMRVIQRENAERSRLRTVAKKERDIGLVPKDVKTPKSPEFAPIVSPNFLGGPFRVCPNCGSESYRPARGPKTGECLNCGPLQPKIDDF